MQKIFLHSFLLTGSLLLFVIVHAQNKTSSTPEERANKVTEWMRSNLQLSDDQVKKVQPINLKYANKTQEMQTGSLSRKQKMQILKENDKAKDAELKQVFTSDQYKSYQAKKEEVRKQMKDRMREKKTHNKVT